MNYFDLYTRPPPALAAALKPSPAEQTLKQQMPIGCQRDRQGDLFR